MKDDSIWLVVEAGKSVHSGIRCESGKPEAKEIRKKMTKQTGREWKTLKLTKKELAAAV